MTEHAPRPAAPEPLWLVPRRDPLLADGALHLWQADLDAAPARLRRWRTLLWADETARAARLCCARDRERFVAARGMLRELLGFYARLPASQVRLGYGARGKPFLAAPAPRRVFFNLSHCGGRAIFAFAARGEVGVDLERLRDGCARRAPQLLSPPERRALSGEPQAARAAFFRQWTRKEAYWKAGGEGIAAPRLLDVSASHEWSRARVWQPGAGCWREDPRWSLRTLEVGSHHAAALATESPRELKAFLLV